MTSSRAPILSGSTAVGRRTIAFSVPKDYAGGLVHLPRLCLGGVGNDRPNHGAIGFSRPQFADFFPQANCEIVSSDRHLDRIASLPPKRKRDHVLFGQATHGAAGTLDLSQLLSVKRGVEASFTWPVSTA